MEKTINKKGLTIAGIVLLACIIVVIGTELIAHGVMTDFGSVDVSNVWIENVNGLMIRGKLFKPAGVSEESPAPGVVYLHGYQNNRETSDPYAIELSRRGFVVLNIDTLGRGNSENQFSEDDPAFDPTYGGDSAFEYLRSLPFVDSRRCGIGGHSLGGEMSYTAAMTNPAIRAIVFSGFAYTLEATLNTPRNMLMIFGKYDEYRKRMTGVRDLETEWMESLQTKGAFPAEHPAFDTTYGSFADGTARRVHMTRTTHVGEAFDKGAIGEAVTWFQQALGLGSDIPADDQRWRIKEVCSLLAMLFAIFSIIPLSVLLIASGPFRSLAGRPNRVFACTKRDFRKAVTINGILELLYIPLILTIFGFHVYVLRIDRVFPMMMVNGIVFWFIVINIIGFFSFKRWVRKERAARPEITYIELGISGRNDHVRPSRSAAGKAFLLAAVLFLYVYLLQSILEHFLLIDFRYKFPYASDLTPFRFLMFLEYFVLFLIGYIQLNIFLQGQIRPVPKKTWLMTSLSNSLRNILVVVVPLVILWAVQYIPLLTTGTVPFVGPGGALVGFMINLEHMWVLLVMMITLSTFLYESTGTIYTGAVLNALLVSWMFTSSSVLAPLPI